LVPETLELHRLLEIFRQKKTQMAVVLDEYGGTEGLVTLEDVLEELVGTIHDEHRREDAEVVRRDETTWLVSGSAGLDGLLEAVGRSDLRAAAPGDVSTVGGLVQAQLDRVAVAGDRIAWNGLSFEVTEVVGRRIDRLVVSVIPAGPAGDADH
jgi:putative hemolysin